MKFVKDGHLRACESNSIFTILANKVRDREGNVEKSCRRGIHRRCNITLDGVAQLKSSFSMAMPLGRAFCPSHIAGSRTDPAASLGNPPAEQSRGPTFHVAVHRRRDCHRQKFPAGDGSDGDGDGDDRGLRHRNNYRSF